MLPRRTDGEGADRTSVLVSRVFELAVHLAQVGVAVTDDAEILLLQLRLQLQAVEAGKVDVEQSVIRQFAFRLDAVEGVKESLGQRAEEVLRGEPRTVDRCPDMPPFQGREPCVGPMGEAEVGMERQPVETHGAGTVQLDVLRTEVQAAVQCAAVEADGIRRQGRMEHLQSGDVCPSVELREAASATCLRQSAGQGVEPDVCPDAALQVGQSQRLASVS